MTWLPFYKEVVQVLATYENRQSELIDLLREMQAAGLNTISLNDQSAVSVSIPLTQIDPFTFLGNFHFTGIPKRIEMWRSLRQKWSIAEAVPDSFDGVPLLNPQSAWFFAYHHTRQPEDIPTLWEIFQIARTNTEIPADLFCRALQINNIGVSKLTIGLFWVNAEKHLTLDGTMQRYLMRFGIVPDLNKIASGNSQEYQRILAQVHKTLGYDHIKISSDAWHSKTAAPPVGAVSASANASSPPQALPSFPRNQILYGPPGTGKTFSSVARAVEIIDGVIGDDRAETVARFEELRAAGQIGFVTFHQSFAYEEFVEGLRPVLDDNADGTARYEMSDGIFKRMALRAIATTLQAPISVPSARPPFEPLWDEFLNRIETDAPYEIPGLSTGKYRLEVTPRGTIYGENITGNAKQPYNTSRGKVREVWQKLGAEEKPTHNRLHAILERGAHNNLIGAIIEELRRIAAQEESTLAVSTPDEARAVTPEDAREWLSDKTEWETAETQAPRFVLIIDEINRGNISKLFGELITLLEPDKRLGAPNELRVVLPYSRETFGVPENLYLLGTMNTADKSLALLDIALRRRFEFEELRPDFSVCLGLSDRMREVLRTLNARLMRVLDREHRIGHAPWIAVRTADEWNRVFLKQIVPLLQEYFYNDWENLRAVLGESGNGSIVQELKPLDGLKSRTHYAWWFDCNESPAQPDFLNILAKNFRLEE